MPESDRREPGHEGHDHDAHAGHDHDAHAGHDHDDHAGHDHDDHDDHDDHSGHGHEGHDHDDHEGHDHDAHAGHDHDAHEGHDHDDHEGHDDHSGHGHEGHDHAHDLRGASRRNLLIALVLISSYMVAEVIGGILSGSLALLADAGHMLTDAAAIIMALVAMWIGGRAASPERTFGYYRTEVLAAMANAFGLWVIASWILFEAYHRVFTEEVHVDGLPVLIVGIGGFLINLAAAWVLHRSSEHSVNVEGAFQHVLADLLGSVAVIVSGVVILTTGWNMVDPILSVLIALFIVWNTRGLLMTVLNVLLEGVPKHIDVYKLCSDLEEVEGVTFIHDVHVWTITSGNEAFTAHILMDPDYPVSDDHILRQMHHIAKDVHKIGHVTLQLERSAGECTEQHHVDHLVATSRAD